MKVFWVLALALVVFVSAISTGWRLLFNLAWLLTVVTLFSYLWARLSFQGLRILRETPQGRVQVGDALRERLGLRNTSILPKLWLEVHDGGNLPGRGSGNVVSLGPNSDKRWRRKTVCTRRGKYVLGPLTITSSDPFGLFTRTVEAGPRTDLLVYPQVLPLPDFSIPALEMPGGNIAQRRSPNSTPTVSSVRDYVHGDSLSSVSWRATARHQKLMVKEFDLDPVADVWIVLDMDRRLHSALGSKDRHIPDDPDRPYLNSTVEYTVTAAASIAASMLDKGRSVGLLTNAAQAEVMPPDRGPRQLWKILEVLAVVEPGDTPHLQETLLSYQPFFTGNHSVLVITPDISANWRQALDSGGRTRPVTAVYIDALTFDSRMPRLLPSRVNSRSRLQTYTIRNGDDLRDVFARGSSNQLETAI